MITKRLVLISLFMFFVFELKSFSQGIYDEKRFIENLISQKKYDLAIYGIDQLSNTEIPFRLNDSLLYLKGHTHFLMKNLDESAEILQNIKQDQLKIKSQFLASYSHTYLGNYKVSISILNELDLHDDVLAELKNMQLGGISLLERDTSKYRLYAKGFHYSYYAYSKEEVVLDELYHEILNFKPKSFVVAGLLSAIIPGSGKIYAGRTGEGIYALFANIVLAAITRENYLKAGSTNFKTLFFGSMLTTFYIGNIYGSVASVKKYRTDFNYEMDYRILYTIHIPLRTMF